MHGALHHLLGANTGLTWLQQLEQKELAPKDDNMTAIEGPTLGALRNVCTRSQITAKRSCHHLLSLLAAASQQLEVVSLMLDTTRKGAGCGEH